MKKFVVLILAVALSLSTLPASAIANTNTIKVEVNGTLINFDVSPAMIQGRTLVPLRGIFEAMGVTPEWNSETQMIRARSSAGEVVLTIGSRLPMVNGRLVQIDVPATLIKGRTMVPTRFIAESLGATVNWDAKTSTVKITGEKAAAINNSRQNPAGLNETFTVTRDSLFSGIFTYEIEMVDVLSGEEAWRMVEAANMFNSEPDPGMEYILAKFRVKVLNVEGNQAATIYSAMFDTFSGSGTKYTQMAFVAGLEPDFDTELFAGAENTGWVAFLVNQSDTNPLAASDRSTPSELWFKLRP